MSHTGEYHGLAPATELGRVQEAVRELLLCGKRFEVAEALLVDYDGRVSDLKRAEDAMLIAARNLTRAVDALPPDRQPRGWSG